MRRRKKTRTALIAWTVGILALSLLSAFIIKWHAESRAKDFLIDTFVMKQGIYEDRQTADQNIKIQETRWEKGRFCIIASAYLGEGSSRVTTSIIIAPPMIPYALNMESAKKEVRLLGEC